jgi:hypothetical protein
MALGNISTRLSVKGGKAEIISKCGDLGAYDPTATFLLLRDQKPPIC